MMYMEDGISMETIFGDGSQAQSSLVDKLVGAGKRLLTGESLFMTVFINEGQGKKHVAFGAPYPGKIIRSGCPTSARADRAEGLVPRRGERREHRHRLPEAAGAGLFGGEGFIMQRLQGDGWCSSMRAERSTSGSCSRGDDARRHRVHCGPSASVDYDIEFVGKIKSALFGGEGLFFATLRGPGRIWLQSLPLSRLAGESTPQHRSPAAAAATRARFSAGSAASWVGTNRSEK